jgi:hypothetical protein
LIDCSHGFPLSTLFSPEHVALARFCEAPIRPKIVFPTVATAIEGINERLPIAR